MRTRQDQPSSVLFGETIRFSFTRTGIMPPKRATSARFDVWARSAICTMREMGAKVNVITKAVKKSDGTGACVRAIEKILARKAADPAWRGEDDEHSGRPQLLDEGQQKQILKLVFQERGRAVVTVSFCKKKLPFLRNVSRSTVERALHTAGLTWLRRRQKRVVPKLWKEKRVEYSQWLLAQPKHRLARFAYTDGTTFYLSRGPADDDEKRRAALGVSVWRMSTGKD
jgi:transposase